MSTLQLALIAMLSLVSLNGWAVKPSPPLSLTVRVAPLPGQSDRYRVRCEARTLIHGAWLHLSALPPAGVELNNGAVQWQGAVPVDGVVVMEFVVTAPRTVLPLQWPVVGRLSRAGIPIFESAYPVHIEGPVSNGAAPRATGVVIERHGSRQGRSIVEYGPHSEP